MDRSRSFAAALVFRPRRGTTSTAAIEPAAPAVNTAARRALTTRLDEVIEWAIHDKRIVGTVVVVAHQGRIVYRKAHGLADREATRPMAVDTVHRFASLTKPIVAVALLRLADQGKVDLDDAVAKYLPSFRPKVANGSAQAITLRQLLTHTSGLGYRFGEAPDGPYHRLGVSDGLDSTGTTLDENLRRLAQAPLLSPPGTAWNYSLSMDVLGRVLEKITQKDLETAIHDLVTGPLGMSATMFVAKHAERLATPYADGKPEPVRMTEPFPNLFGTNTVDFSPARATDPHAYFSGGAGMVGTADDFIRFLEAVRIGAPLLKETTAARITENAIGELPTLRGPGWGFGLIGAVLVDPRAARQPAPSTGAAPTDTRGRSIAPRLSAWSRSPIRHSRA